LDARRDKALRNALEADPENPSGHYEQGQTYEKRGDWNAALREYQVAQKLLQRLKPGQETQGPGGKKRQYIDLRGNAYSVEYIFQEISGAIKRASAKVQKR
jgi:tetratricopeptide (TPR) repeat protein